MATLDKVQFGLAKGNRRDLDRTSIADVGTFNICKDTEELIMDLDGNRYYINSANFDYTEEEIVTLTNPGKKLYVAKDSFRVYLFDRVNLRWLILGENGVIHHSDTADSDGDGRNIRETYATKSELRTYATNTDASIQELEEAIAILNNYIVEVYENEEDLPDEGISGTIYFVLNPGSDIDNPVYDEYIWVTDGYYVKVGATQVDLRSYVTRTELGEELEVINENISSAVDRISGLESTLSNTIEPNISDLQSTASDHGSRISALEDEDIVLSNNISSHASSITYILDTINDMNSTMTSTLDNHASSIGDIYDILAGIMTSVSNMDLSISNLEAEVNGGSTASTASGSIATRVTELENSVSALESSMSTVEDVTASNLRNITSHASSISALESSMSSMSSSMANATSEITSLQSSMADASSSISTLEEESLKRENETRGITLDFNDET